MTRRASITWKRTRRKCEIGIPGDPWVTRLLFDLEFERVVFVLPVGS